MPTRETIVHLAMNSDISVLNHILETATRFGGGGTVAQPETGDDAAEIHAQFPDPENAQNFVTTAERAGARLIRLRLTREAALSWIRNYGNVKSAGSAAYGGSITALE